MSTFEYIKTKNNFSAPPHTMSAAVITNPGKVEIHEVPLRNIEKDEILFKVEGCGVCASSIPLWEGRNWFTYPLSPGQPGHEAWGTVIDTGEEVKNIQKGDRISSLTNNSFASFDITKEDQCIKIPDALRNQFFPGEPLGCAFNILKRSAIKESEKVAVVGCGFLGLLLIQLLKEKKCEVFAISNRNFSLEKAMESGANHIFNIEPGWEVSSKINKLTGYVGCTTIIETTGKQIGLDLSTEIVAEGGKIIVAGYHQDGLRQVNMQKWNWKGIDVVNAHERKTEKYLEGMRDAVKAIENGFNPYPLFTHKYSLDEVDIAFSDLIKRPDGFIKGLVIL